MSVYDKTANGRGRYDESVFVGGTKISSGPMKYWRAVTQRQWDSDGCPSRDADPSNPYWTLMTYKTFVCARTVAELDRIIESAKWAGWRNVRINRPAPFSRYFVYYGNKRQAAAIDRVRDKLLLVRGHIRRITEDTGYVPYGVNVAGDVMGYRQASEAYMADEALAALVAWEG